VQIDGLIETIGYPAVFLLVMGECMGVPMPGETALLIAAAASGTGGMFKIEWVIVSAAGGAIVGDTIGYWIGWRGGRALILRLMKRFSIKPVHLEKAERFFARHGGMAVFFGRSVSYLRVLTALLAGVSRMRYPRFLMFNAMGGISWAIVFGLAGYFFGKNIGFIEERIHEIALGFLVAVAIGVAVYFFKKKSKKT
jgi:membrane protein DedA with SNARE-associated domain